MIQSVAKAISWLTIGVVFGLASLILIFASHAIFTHPISTGRLIDGNIVMFLCVALMSGAAADYLLCACFHLGWRISVFSITLIALLIVFFMFSPNNTTQPDEYIVYKLAWGYAIFTFFYCVLIKANIFFKESEAHKKKRKF